MVREALLDRHISAGESLVRELDRRNKRITSAVWYHDPDHEHWRLLLASPEFDTIGIAAAYGEIWRLLLDMPQIEDVIALEDITVVMPDEPLGRMLRKMRHVGGLRNIRVQTAGFDGFYVDDALIYRNESQSSAAEPVRG